jgi:hypothetical protein
MGVKAFIGAIQNFIHGTKKELEGLAAIIFGSGPNMNSKLDKHADKPHLREQWAQENWGLSWEEVRVKLPRREVSVYTVSLPAGDTCPGKSAFCTFCYALKGRVLMMQARYQKTLDTLLSTDYEALLTSITALPLSAWIRIHASGDFFSAEYVRAWISALKSRPDVKAWAYTRSWDLAAMSKSIGKRKATALLKALEELRALPNMQLFASVDKTMTDVSYVVSKNWRIAYIEGDERFEGTGFQCPEQAGDKKRPDCKSCALCPVGRKGNIRFMMHSNNVDKIKAFLTN